MAASSSTDNRQQLPASVSHARLSRVEAATNPSDRTMVAARRAIMDDDEDDCIRIEIAKGNCQVYGLAYCFDEVQGLIVTGIMPQSPVGWWNQSCERDSVICVGDEIVSVNQKKQKQAIDELAENRLVDLIVRRTGPRWHLGQPSLGAPTQKDMLKQTIMQRQISKQLPASAPTISSDEEILVRQDEDLTVVQFILIYLSVLLPCTLLMLALSDIGYGLKFYAMFADDGKVMTRDPNMIGNGIICLATGTAVVLYVFDWRRWKSMILRGCSAFAIIYTTCVGVTMKSKHYPQAPMVIVLFHLPVFLGILRTSLHKHVKRRSFYLAVSVSTASVAICILFIFLAWATLDAWDGSHTYDDATKAQLARDSKPMYDAWVLDVNGRERSIVYEWDCSELVRHTTDFDQTAWEKYGKLESSGYKMTAEEREGAAKACANVKTTWFLVWMAPLICMLINLVLAIFCLINAALLNSSTMDATKLEKVLKQFVLMIAILVLTMWVSASIAGASMRLTSTIMAFCGSGCVALLIWLYMEIGKQALTQTMQTSRLTKMMLGMATNDWVRAMVIIGLNMLIPSFLLINMLQERVRYARGLTEKKQLFTPGVYTFVVMISRWRWSSILTKCNLLVILYWTFSVGVAKITYVFLSWLNETLMQVDLSIVCITFFLVGYTMFLLPPVPGIPVYICSGIVISARSSTVEGLGFWGGVVIAVAISFVLKLAAVCGQYGIGVFMGRSLKIQQLVAVDKVFTRSIEKILKTQGLNLPKVSVLVGGPDWPTSVLCGILRLSLFQCVLGTTPVIIVSSPCVLAGAFMSGPNVFSSTSADTDSEEESSESGVFNALQSFMLALSFLVQMASGVIALYFIQEYIHKYGDEFAVPRADHAPVIELTKREEEYNRAHDKVTEFTALPISLKLTLLASTGTMLISFFTFMFMDEACFRSFQVNGRICDDIAEGGLGCDVTAIVKPLGRLVNVAFFVSVGMHVAYVRLTARRAETYLAMKKEEGRDSRVLRSATAGSDTLSTRA